MKEIRNKWPRVQGLAQCFPKRETLIVTYSIYKLLLLKAVKII